MEEMTTDAEPKRNHYAEYCKRACPWCLKAPVVWIRVYTPDDGPWHCDELGDKVERCTALSVKDWAEQIAANLEQVDDVLIVNWITVKNNDYRQALADLITRNIAEHEDPALNGITGVAMRHRETMMIYSLPKPARHDTLIRKLVEMGERVHAHGEQGFVDVSGAFLTREEAFVRAARVGQFLKKSILLGEDVW